MIHKFWSPSAMGRNVFCNGAPFMAASYDDKSGSEAIEGEAAHWVAALWIQTGNPCAVGETAPNGFVITQEIIDNVREYVTACTSIEGGHHIEEYVDIKRIHEADCGGTPDHWVVDPTSMTLYVDDLKYGWGLVESFWQNMAYASGIIDILGVSDLQLNVCLRIHQPRPHHPHGPMREWRAPAEDLRGYINQMHNAANSTPVLCSGSHCKNCVSILGCEANRKASLNAIDIADMPVGIDQANISNELELLQHASDTIKNRLTALESTATEMITGGESVQGWALEAGRGKLDWISDNSVIIATGDIMGVDLRNKKPITPTQAKKTDLPKDVISSMAKFSSGKLKLTRTTETLAGAVFKGD